MQIIQVDALAQTECVLGIGCGTCCGSGSTSNENGHIGIGNVVVKAYIGSKHTERTSKGQNEIRARYFGFGIGELAGIVQSWKTISKSVVLQL